MQVEIVTSRKVTFIWAHSDCVPKSPMYTTIVRGILARLLTIYVYHENSLWGSTWSWFDQTSPYALTGAIRLFSGSHAVENGLRKAKNLAAGNFLHSMNKLNRRGS